MKLIRIKPYNPKIGNVLRRYNLNGYTFEVERGWYKVDDDVAEYLKGVHQHVELEHSPLAFDVCTEEEAAAIDDREIEAAKVKRASAEPTVVSTAQNPTVVGSPAPAPAPQALLQSQVAPTSGKRR